METTEKLKAGGRAIRTQQFNGKTYHLYEGERYYSRGTKRLHRVVWEYYNGPIPEGYEIHHKDRNPENNDISNLVCVSSATHEELHREENVRRNSTPEAIAHLYKIAEKAKEWHRSAEGREWHKDHAKEEFEKLSIRRKTCECCGKEFEYKSFNIPRFCSNACKSRWRRRIGADNETRICVCCGKEFKANHYSDTITWSKSCAAKYRWKRIKDGTGV